MSRFGKRSSLLDVVSDRPAQLAARSPLSTSRGFQQNFDLSDLLRSTRTPSAPAVTSQVPSVDRRIAEINNINEQMHEQVRLLDLNDDIADREYRDQQYFRSSQTRRDAEVYNNNLKVLNGMLSNYGPEFAWTIVDDIDGTIFKPDITIPEITQTQTRSIIESRIDNIPTSLPTFAETESRFLDTGVIAPPRGRSEPPDEGSGFNFDDILEEVKESNFGLPFSGGESDNIFQGPDVFSLEFQNVNKASPNNRGRRAQDTTFQDVLNAFRG
jgi:hypothetical protein